jgi:DNA-binding PadR family transcriptional regulator
MKRAIAQQSVSLWEIAVLSSLRESSMHPYEIQKLLHERGKDEVLALKLSSLYHAINRLLRAQLIETVGTRRNGRRPERTTYRITPAGEQALTSWLRQLIAEPKLEPSEFTACLSFLVYLTPHDATTQLEARAARLDKEISEINRNMASIVAVVGRINLIEEEYRRAMRQAELEWIRGLTAELLSGKLRWDLEEILQAIRAAKMAAEVSQEDVS